MSGPSAYPDLPGLEEVYLEGAPVERLVVDDQRVVLVIEAALLGDHPDYSPPPAGEVHCRAPLLLDWRKAASVDWTDRSPDDLGALTSFEVTGDRMTLRGGFGRIVVRGRPPRVTAPRN
ncbi:MAG: hypothetical protein AAGD18_04025 [Actinomycetota bacterium]